MGPYLIIPRKYPAWGQCTRYLGPVYSLLEASVLVTWGQCTIYLWSVHSLLEASVLVTWGQCTRYLGPVYSLLWASVLFTCGQCTRYLGPVYSLLVLTVPNNLSISTINYLMDTARMVLQCASNMSFFSIG